MRLSLYNPRRTVGTVVLVALAMALASTWAHLVSAQQPGLSEWPETDFAKRSVELSEIFSGGPPKDGIPAIDKPKFMSVNEARKIYEAREPVVALRIGDDARAYPLSILIWHEIANDVVGGVPVSVTFCPLCNATLIFDRRVGERILDFGTTGRLRKSDMVMYDRQTQSWWQQFTGAGIVGEMTGVKLTQLPAQIIAFEDFVAAHPYGKVLSRDTGHRRDYGANPYRGYDAIDNRPFLYSDPVDPRLPAMERVVNISVGGVHRLYPFRAFATQPVINDVIADHAVVVFSKRGTLSVLDSGEIAASREIPSATAFSRRVNGKTLHFEVRDDAIVDTDSGSRWNLLGTAVSGPLRGTRLEPVPSGVHFAFAWLAFRPQSEIYAP